MAKIPLFHSPERVGSLFYPDAEAIAAEAAGAGLRPASEDAVRVTLLLIDMQVDFCHRNGSLCVPGAEDDIRRAIRFICSNAERISHIACTLDSHLPFQIFHAAWWTDAKGAHPKPYTVIAEKDVKEGVWRPVFEPEWSREYVVKLRERSKKELVIWPYHVPIGGVGGALDPELWSIVFWHAVARKSQPTLWSKGGVPKTEHYSVLRPEIPASDAPGGGLSLDFLGLLERNDYILIGGEAETHCVIETVRDMVEIFGGAREKLSKIVILRDCMSPVRHPDVDFHAATLDQFREYERKGVRFMNSSEALPFPP